MDVVLASTSSVGTDYKRVVFIVRRGLCHCIKGDEGGTDVWNGKAGRLCQVIALGAVITLSIGTELGKGA